MFVSRTWARITSRLAAYANQFVLATRTLRLATSKFIFQLNICGYRPYVTSSLTRGWVCHLKLLLVLASAVILRSESRGTHDHSLLSQIRESPNLEDQAPVFISPRNRVGRLCPQALGYLFVASYDSQGYGGGIGPRLHKGVLSLLDYCFGSPDVASGRTLEKTPLPAVPSVVFMSEHRPQNRSFALS
jgi:hypothetical protein